MRGENIEGRGEKLREVSAQQERHFESLLLIYHFRVLFCAFSASHAKDKGRGGGGELGDEGQSFHTLPPRWPSRPRQILM